MKDGKELNWDLTEYVYRGLHGVLSLATRPIRRLPSTYSFYNNGKVHRSIDSTHFREVEIKYF